MVVSFCLFFVLLHVEDPLAVPSELLHELRGNIANLNQTRHQLLWSGGRLLQASLPELFKFWSEIQHCATWALSSEHLRELHHVSMGVSRFRPSRTRRGRLRLRGHGGTDEQPISPCCDFRLLHCEPHPRHRFLPHRPVNRFQTGNDAWSNAISKAIPSVNSYFDTRPPLHTLDKVPNMRRR